ncbi:hypothetical protein EHV08_09965 [Prevotella koreensis]|uniref:Uncharacterized protein n=1 Tax=Prevotella koreensis TaxID=2490854 RepID=A0A3S0PVK5_9BACT|nr:hypothetical protein EHV08_09965 [Prevotella koreensis]
MLIVNFKRNGNTDEAVYFLNSIKNRDIVWVLYDDIYGKLL